MNKNLYIGVMSGTSLDGIDIALVSIDGDQIRYQKGQFFPYDVKLRRLIEIICLEANVALFQLGELQVKLSRAYALAIKKFLSELNISSNEVTAIGCHGQTVFHRPQGQFPFSMQLVDPSVIAAETGIATVTDFRAMDLALGGQGAPLIPAFHQAVLNKEFESNATALLNIGGMANLTIFRDGKVTGFDTGPGNILMDLWCQKHFALSFDKNGQLAAQGSVDKGLLADWLQDEYFNLPAPKSTGREYFNLSWLERHLPNDHNTTDVLATLTALTAQSVANDLLQHSEFGHLILFGGGAHNQTLVARLNSSLPGWTISASVELGIPEDYMEAAAFAWFAHLRMSEKPLPLATVTGGQDSAICGVVALAPCA